MFLKILLYRSFAQDIFILQGKTKTLETCVRRTIIICFLQVLVQWLVLQWWWIDEHGDGWKGRWMKEGLCRRGVHFNGGLVTLFCFVKLILLLSVAKRGDPGSSL